MFRRWIDRFVEAIHVIKDKQLQWRLANQEALDSLKHQQALSDQALAALLQERNLQLAHKLEHLQIVHQARIDQLKVTQHAQLSMLKTKSEQDIKDYQQYLQSLNELKKTIQRSYRHLPEAVAFTIHHHAKYLLNQMWDAETLDDKLKQEIRFIRFMATVQDDAKAQLTSEVTHSLPVNTLRLLQESDIEP